MGDLFVCQLKIELPCGMRMFIIAAHDMGKLNDYLNRECGVHSFRVYQVSTVSDIKL